MANNKTRSFKQTRIKFATGVPDDLNETATAVTNTKPAVLNTAAVLQDADVVYISSASLGQVNGFYQVKKTGANSYELSGTDFTYVGQELDDVKFAKVEMSPFCAATSLEIEPATTSETDTTTNCDEYPQKEMELESGSASMDLYWNPEDDVQAMLLNLFLDLKQSFFQFQPKDVNQVEGYRVVVSSYSYNGAVGDKYQGSVGFTLQSKPMITKLA